MGRVTRRGLLTSLPPALARLTLMAALPRLPVRVPGPPSGGTPAAPPSMLSDALTRGDPVDLLMGGGGLRGLAFIGLLKRAKEAGVRITGIGGASAGALVAGLYAAGYAPGELEKLVLTTDFQSLLDNGSTTSPRNVPRLIREWGLDSGAGIERWLDDLIRRKRGTSKSVVLRDIDMDLRITASDVTSHRQRILSRRTEPTLRLSTAIRMSIGFPFLFEPYRRGRELLVDGGLLSVVPSWLFADSPHPTLSARLVESPGREPIPPSGFVEYARDLIGALIARSASAEEIQLLRNTMIFIDTGTISGMDFAMSRNQKAFLIRRGYQATAEFLTRTQRRDAPGRKG